MATRSADVVVVGGGPAGTTVATLVRRSQPGSRVLLLEREPFPRHHVGESLLPNSNRVLQKLGVLERIERAGFQRKGGITYRWRDDRPPFSEVFARGGVTAAGVPDYAWQIDRSRYDELLLEHARDAGVEVAQPASAAGVIRDGDAVLGVTMTRPGGGETAVECGHLVDCSGQARWLARALALPRRDHELGDYALYRYYRTRAWPEALFGARALSRIFFAATPAGWVWCIPLAGDLLSVGLVTRRALAGDREPAALYEQQIDTVHELRALLDGATAAPPPGGGEAGALHSAANWSYSHARAAGPGWYLAGDAAAFVDPILSSGVMLAHYAGLAVANAIHTERAAPEIDRHELWDGYTAYYRDVCAGFHGMAEWWYRQRQRDIGDWWRTAQGMWQSARPSLQLDDVSAFMGFAAGYLTDFRFANVEIGFGPEGLGICIEALTGRDAGPALGGTVADHARVARSAVSSIEVGAYLATFVDTDRWWRLPLVTMSLASGDAVYRPPIACDDAGRPEATPVLRYLDHLVDACDGVHSFLDAVATARAAAPGCRDADLIASDLVALGAVCVDGAPARVGSGATAIDDRTRRVAARFAHVTADADALVFTVDGRPVRYRAPRLAAGALVTGPAGGRITRALVDACDGRRTVDDVVRHVRAGSHGAPAEAVNDLANIALCDLVSLGVLALT
jgi:flavin-dependent dehydrogenase